MLSKKALLNYLPLILIVLLASFLRLFLLDKIPNAIGGDELVYIMNAKSLFLSGHDIFGQWTLLQGLLFIYPKGEVAAELPYLLFMPIVGLTNFSIFTAHLTNAILGILSVVMIFFVVQELVDRRTALWTGFITAINPWLIYINRTAYEATPAVFFYLISFYILLKAKGWKILIAFPFLLLAFYSYIGTKIILIPFTLVVSVYCYLFINHKKYIKQYAALLALCVLLTLFYLLSLHLHPGTSRLNEVLDPTDPQISQQVNYIRSTSMQTPILNIFVNKYTLFINIVFVKILSSFAIRYLFIQGDEFFSIYRHGLFYYLDAFFIVLGSLFLFSKRRIFFILLCALLLVGTMPQVFHSSQTSDYSLHLTMLFPFLTILVGAGIVYLIDFFKNKRNKTIVFIFVLGAYFIFLANFLNIYISWFPLRGYFDFPIRIASDYINLSVKSGNKVTVFSDRTYDFYKKYLFYANALNKNTYLTIRENLLNENYQIGQVQVLGCDNTINPAMSKNVIVYDSDCAPLKNKTIGFILPKTLSGGGQSYNLYNDKICRGAGLKTYPYGIKISDFDVEKMPAKQFCETYVNSY